MNRTQLVCTAAAAALVWTGSSTAVLAAGDDPGGGPISNKHAPNFTVDCRFSHRLADDPIVKPGRPGATHSHDFFGNTSTDAFSTDASLRAAGTTCNRPADTAAYWMPTVLQDGKPVRSARATVYFRNGAEDPTTLVGFPAGFRMIAGDPAAVRAPRARHIGWACRHATGRKGSWTTSVPTCPSGQPLVFRVRFPECWNGRDVTVPDARSHVAYPLKSGGCPSAFPVRLPRLSMTQQLDSSGGPGVTLSSGDPATSGHADFINTWDQAALDELTEDCLRQGIKCGFRDPLAEDAD